MKMELRGTVTRASNGSVDIRPAADQNTFGIDRVTVHTAGTPSEKDWPIDGEATVTIESGVRSAEFVGAVESMPATKQTSKTASKAASKPAK